MKMYLEYWSIIYLTQSRLFWRPSSQPITWLILTNKTLQENTQTKYNSKSKWCIIQQKNYSDSVISYDTWPGNEIGIFHKVPKLRRGKMYQYVF